MAEGFDRVKDILELEASLDFPSNNERRQGMRRSVCFVPKFTGPVIGAVGKIVKYDSSGMAHLYDTDGNYVGPWIVKK